MDGVAAQNGGQKENHRHAPSRYERINRGAERRALPGATPDELGRVEDARERVATETTGSDLERSAGRATGPEVHEPGDCHRTDLAVGARRRRKAKPVTRTEEPVPGRVESSPGVCAARPSGRSDPARNRTADRMATAQCAGLLVSERSETRLQAAYVLAQRRARVPAQRLSCSRKARKRCFCASKTWPTSQRPRAGGTSTTELRAIPTRPGCSRQ